MLLVPKNARLIGQGITGQEGIRSLPWSLNYGTQIVAGVTPGKGGQEILGVPIFNSVKEAIDKVGMVDGSVQFVPPIYTLNAVNEALNEGIKFILIGAEKVPVKDSSIIYSLSKRFNASIIGPSSIGQISPHRNLKIGVVGGENPERSFVDGDVAIVSKSGGMLSEMGGLLKRNNLGVSWAVGIGGDRLVATDFVDFLLELEEDSKTKASLIFGELGGTYEERLAEYVKRGKIKKPVVAFIAGEFTMSLPSDVQFGHAGAIIEGKRGLPSEKRRILKEAGVHVAENFDEIPKLVKSIIQ